MKFKLFFILNFLVGGVFAQSSEMVTDRPYHTQSSKTLPLKTFQIESGFWYAHSKAGKTETELISYHSTLLRFGLLKNFELRLGMEYKSAKVTSDIKPVDEIGWTPLMIGGKIHIVEEKGLRPDIAFLGHLTLPFTGVEAFQPDYVAPDFRFAFSHTLGKRFSLRYNLGLEWPSGLINKDVLGIYSLVIDFAIFDQLRCYVENYGYADALYGLDVGFTFLLIPNLQFDLNGGFGLSPNSPDNYIGLGISWRIPR